MNTANFIQRKLLSEISICNRLNLSLNDYNALQYELALEYLSELFGQGNPIMERLEKTHAFWTWWKVRYVLFNEVFLKENNHSIQEYKDLQSEASTFPPACVYHESKKQLVNTI